MQIRDYSIAVDPLLDETIYYPANLSILSTQLKFTVFASNGTMHKNMRYIVITLPNGKSRIRLGSKNIELIDEIYKSVPWQETIMHDDRGNEFKYKTAPSPQELISYMDNIAINYAEKL